MGQLSPSGEDERLSILKSVGRLASAGIFVFILFSDDALPWLTSLPLQLNYTVSGIVITGLGVFAYGRPDMNPKRGEGGFSPP